MELGMVGLGRMGGNITKRLLSGSHTIVAFDPDKQAVEASVRNGAAGAASLPDLVNKLGSPRIIWLMVHSGEVTENTINNLKTELIRGDIIIDGGNSNYKDSLRRAGELSEQGIHFMDVGTSGGIWGLENGYCLMVGGNRKTYDYLIPVFQTLAPSSDNGFGYMGPSGAGHFVKMIHNGIEYGLMQAYAEGFELMQAKHEFNLDLHQVAEIWRYGSVVRSWLLDLITEALKENPELEGIQSFIEDSGEGRWTVEESVDLGVPTPVITQALQARFRSRQDQPFGGKMLAALRQQFGGHAVRKEDY